MSSIKTVQVQCPECLGTDLVKGTQDTGYPYWKCKTCGKTFALENGNETCMFCGSYVPEGSMICYSCAHKYSKKR